MGPKTVKISFRFAFCFFFSEHSGRGKRQIMPVRKEGRSTVFDFTRSSASCGDHKTHVIAIV